MTIYANTGRVTADVSGSVNTGAPDYSDVLTTTSTITSNTTTTVYTVPAGKKLFVTDLTMTCDRAAGWNGYWTIAGQATFGGGVWSAVETNRNGSDQHLTTPIELVATETITITTTNVVGTCYATITGRLQDA